MIKSIVVFVITSGVLVGFPLGSGADAPTATDSSTDSSESVGILEITRHTPTKLSRLRNMSSVAFQVSATGVVAPTFFRTSTDGGLTWGPEQTSSDHVSNGQASGTMPRGGSIKAGEGKGRPGWFEFKMFHFNDDFSEHKIEWFRVHMPGSTTEPVKGRSYVWDWPRFCSNIVQLAGGDLITVMFGLFEGHAVGSDYGSRVIACRSVGLVASWANHVCPIGARSIFQVTNGGW